MTVSPQVAAAAASTRDESELRALLRAKLEAEDAYRAHRRMYDMRDVSSLSMDERVDLEAESNRLWNIQYAAALAVADYNLKQRKAA